ncbi:MAG TPA: sigma-70 family RNA polymerase sigma factor [Gammaproteobacteria bacterium]|nr:sigma-70 family RNA polymerase sigma factor [Gammaproteobacteria bacterium]
MTEEATEIRNRELVDLLHGCALGRQADFARLYELTSPQLFSVLMRMFKRRDLAEDALQEAFTSVWRNAGSYTAERGTPMTWLMSICRYRALDMLRDQRHEVPLGPGDDGDGDMEEAFLDSASGAEEISHAEARALSRCLDRLQQAQRNSLRFAYFQGLSHDEIAVRLQAPIGTVKSWVRRGLQSLKRCLEAA